MCCLGSTDLGGIVACARSEHREVPDAHIVAVPIRIIASLVLLMTPQTASAARPPVEVRVSDVYAVEGDVDNSPAIILMTLSRAATQVRIATPQSVPVTVGYRVVADGTAMAHDDLPVGTGTVTIQPGDRSEPITVAVRADTTPEPDETYQVRLTSTTLGAIQRDIGMGTILDDD
jgi:hypothetical protein